MAIQTINIGNRVNDGLGDDLRTAFEKVNANFSELDSSLTVTASNASDSGFKIFKQKVNNNLEFKTLVEAAGINITENENTLSIGLEEASRYAFRSIDTDSGTIEARVYENITMQGVAAPGSALGYQDIEVTTFGSSINFKTLIPVTEILTIYDFGPLDGSFTNSVQFSLASANVDFGTVTAPGRLDLDCGTLSS